MRVKRPNDQMTPEEFITIRRLLGLAQWELGIHLGGMSERGVRRREQGLVRIRPLEAEKLRTLKAEKAAGMR
jgi:DNA-binding transcriptional regulator YiaG